MREGGQLCFDLPTESWEEGLTLRTTTGRKLRRWGSVAQACRMLFDLRKGDLYLLIEAGEVEAVKRPPLPGKRDRNQHYKVNLVSVWEYRQRVYGR